MTCDGGTGRGHDFAIVQRDENDDRVRTREECRRCGRTRFGCFAKRLAIEPDATGNREAWGPVGEWRYAV